MPTQQTGTWMEVPGGNYQYEVPDGDGGFIYGTYDDDGNFMQGTSSPIETPPLHIDTGYDSEELSDLYGAHSFDGMDTLPGEVSGQDKLENYIEAGLHPGYSGSSGYSGYSGSSGSSSASGGLPEYNPPSGKNVTPLDIANYNANYYKGAFSSSMQENEKMRTGALGQMETREGEYREQAAREQAGNLEQTAEETYTKAPVSALMPGQGFQIDAMTKAEKTAASNLTKATGMMQSPDPIIQEQGRLLYASLPKGVQDNYTNWKSAQMANVPEPGTAWVMTNDEEKVFRDEFGLTDSDVITFTKDGRAMINGKTETESNIERAEARNEADREDVLREKSQAHEIRMSAIRSAYTVDGQLTKQGARMLANTQRNYEEDVTTTNRHYNENLEDYIRSEKGREADVRMKNLAAETPQAKTARIKAQESLDGAYEIQKEYAAKGVTKSFWAAQSEWVDRQDFNKSAPSYAEKATELDLEYASPQFEPTTMFETAMGKFGNNGSEVEKYMKSRQFLASDIQAQRENYQRNVMGYSEEQIRAGTQFAAVLGIVERQAAGEEVSLSDLNYVKKYEENEQNALEVEQARVKLENKEMSPSEVFARAEENIAEREQQKQATEDAEKREQKLAGNAFAQDVLAGLERGEHSVDDLVMGDDITKATAADKNLAIGVYRARQGEYVAPEVIDAAIEQKKPGLLKRFATFIASKFLVQPEAASAAPQSKVTENAPQTDVTEAAPAQALPERKPGRTQCGEAVNDWLGFEVGSSERMGDTLASKKDGESFQEGGEPIVGGYFVADIGKYGHAGIVVGKNDKGIFITDSNRKNRGQLRENHFLPFESAEYKSIVGYGGGTKTPANKKKLTQEEISTKFRAARTHEEQKAILQTLKDDYGIKTAEEARVFMGGR